MISTLGLVVLYFVIGIFIAAFTDRRQVSTTGWSIERTDVVAIMLIWPVVLLINLLLVVTRGLSFLIYLISRHLP